ncbi:hypothetical protein [Tropicimonas marinistellae]|uniref:hypothetical protein n=1 Tax=Tropicimonas marinistellae TaxID=1739787 RepID=UPI00082A2D94|nr:hypothetical protein [Tropicimonas marinistellae]
MFKRLLTGALVFGMAATAPPTEAQQYRCAERDKVTERLEKHYGEHQSGIGLQTSDRLVEFWTSHETGSWTMLLTMPNGLSCIMAAGRNWIEESRPVVADHGHES